MCTFLPNCCLVLQLTSLMQWYKSDFGGSDTERLQWVLQLLRGAGVAVDKADRLSTLLATDKWEVQYLPYDWTHNGAK